MANRLLISYPDLTLGTRLIDYKIDQFTLFIREWNEIT